MEKIKTWQERVEESRSPSNEDDAGMSSFNACLAEIKDLRTTLCALAEPSDEMMRAMLAVRWPATYREYLRHPDNGERSKADTEREIAITRRQYIAAIDACKG